MRLINCSTLQLEEFFGSNIPRYAILSHTWGDEEVSFADFLSSQTTKSISIWNWGGGSRSAAAIQSITDRSGYQKILSTCRQTRRDGLGYAWVDTCCIDKSSSSELSEAINSMFTWYKRSTLCYVYLSDVLKAELKEGLPKSRWFTRGWTLQELLAPTDIKFYDRDWLYLGTKVEHAEWISAITGIDKKALFHGRSLYLRHIDLSTFCVAQKMSWASTRQTTRKEDVAYCLLGIFDINMPLLYGEGDRAFLRLQEEIIRRTDDNSILAWGLELHHKMDHTSEQVLETLRHGMNTASFVGDLLASSPEDFVNCGDLRYDATSSLPFTLTNTGLQIQLPLVPVFRSPGDTISRDVYGWIGLLGCSTASSLEFLGILLCTEVDDDLSARVVRTNIRLHASFYNTIRIVPRTAARSVLEKVTINIFDRMRSVGDSHFNRGHRQVLVNVSQAVKGCDIKVESGTAWNIAEEIYRYNQNWDAEATILTVGGERRFQDIFEFCFANPSGVKFSVFMRTVSSKALIREGHKFSSSDMLCFYEHLGQIPSQYDTGKVEVYDSAGSPLLISVEVRTRRVYDHRLFELNVDAAPTVR